MKSGAFVFVIILAQLAGCAADSAAMDKEPAEEAEYVTGSNIPRKRPAAPPMTEDEKQAIRDRVIQSTGTAKGP